MAQVSGFPSSPQSPSRDSQYVVVETANVVQELMTPGALETPTAAPAEQASPPPISALGAAGLARPYNTTVSDCRSGRSFGAAGSASGHDTPHTAPLPRSRTPPPKRISLTADGVSEELVGGRDQVTFVPFAMYREGNRIHSRSVGWHSDGEVVVLREEVSSASEAEGKDGVERKRSWLTDTRRIEQEIPEKLIAQKGLANLPGTRGPKAKGKRRRWQRAFLMDDDGDDDDDERGPRPGRLTKADFQELFTHRPKSDYSFHEEAGPVDKRWLPFVEITMDKQERLLSRVASAKPKDESQAPRPARTPASSAPTGPQRIGWITRPVRIELTRTNQRRELLVPELEERIQEHLKELVQSERRPLVLEIEDSFHRMLFHAVCEFYCLDSHSHTEDGVRYTIAELRDKYTPEQALETAPLSELLPTRRQVQQDAGQRLKQRHRRRKGMG